MELDRRVAGVKRVREHNGPAMRTSQVSGPGSGACTRLVLNRLQSSGQRLKGTEPDLEQPRPWSIEGRDGVQRGTGLDGGPLRRNAQVP